MMIEELGEDRKLSQTILGCAKVSEGGFNSNVNVTVSHTSVSTIVSTWVMDTIYLKKH
jgi:hypothetical protein